MPQPPSPPARKREGNWRKGAEMGLHMLHVKRELRENSSMPEPAGEADIQTACLKRFPLTVT